MGHPIGFQVRVLVLGTRGEGPKCPENNLLFRVLYAEMESILVLITFGDLVIYEIANEGDDFCPKSEFGGGTNASGVFCCLLCHTLRMWLKQLLCLATAAARRMTMIHQSVDRMSVLGIVP